MNTSPEEKAKELKNKSLTAQEAMQIVETKMPSILDEEYNDITKRIKKAAEIGKTDIDLIDMPSSHVVDKLRNNGYRFYTSGNQDWMFPFFDIYTITWKKQVKRINKKKWYQKIFR